jgi:hypothetical protein
MRSFLSMIFLLLLVPALAPAQDLASGPGKGEKIPALKVYDATGMHKDEEVDYSAERKDKPTLYLLLRADKFDRPMNRFMKGLDKAVKQEYADAYIVAVWLTEDLDKTKELLPNVQQSVRYEATALTCLAGEPTGPKDWNVNVDARITVVVASKQKGAAQFGYNSINETDVSAVQEVLKKVWTEK